MGLSTEDYKSIYPRLFAYAMSRCRNEAVAEDLVSQTMITAVENLDAGLEVNDLTAWCVTVLRNKHLDYIKKKKESQLDPVMPEDQNTEDFNAGGDGFSNILFSECMKRLNSQHSEVMVMNILKGMTTKAISEILNKPQNTILTWLTKAKTEFHDCIEGHA
jgi:RNA polymerase sigma-70 factor (ECF subfamily)